MAAAAVVAPSLVSALSPVLPGRGGRQAPRTASWRRVGRLDEFPVGSVREAVASPPPEKTWPPDELRQGVYVWRPREDDLVVFSRACTDLGCPVNHHPGSGCYFCPCHGGIFNKDGSRMAGPPERPFYRYDVRVVGGVVEIDLESVPAMV